MFGQGLACEEPHECASDDMSIEALLDPPTARFGELHATRRRVEQFDECVRQLCGIAGRHQQAGALQELRLATRSGRDGWNSVRERLDQGDAESLMEAR